MTTLDPDTRILVIRRGELMRISMPMTQYGLDTTSAPELALSAAMLFLQLQTEYPGRADMPITSKTGQLALALPYADDVLNDDQPLWAVLAGEWRPFDLDIVGTLADEMTIFPCCVLNLVDLNHGG